MPGLGVPILGGSVFVSFNQNRVLEVCNSRTTAKVEVRFSKQASYREFDLWRLVVVRKWGRGEQVISDQAIRVFPGNVEVLSLPWKEDKLCQENTQATPSTVTV